MKSVQVRRAGPSIAAIAAILLILGLIVTQFIALEAAEEGMRIEKQKAAEAEILLANMKELQGQEGELINTVGVLSRLLPAEPKESELIKGLQKIADDNGVHLGSIRFGARITDEEMQFVEMPLDVLLEGRYGNVESFVKGLQANERAVRINEIRMEADENDVLSVRMQISVFYSAD